MFNIGNKKKLCILAISAIVICCIAVVAVGVSHFTAFSNEEKNRIEELKEEYPDYFNFKKDNGLNIYTVKMSSETFEYILSEETFSDEQQFFEYAINHTLLHNEEDVNLLIKYYGYEDGQITLIPIHYAISSCAYVINDSFVSELSEKFDNKYAVCPLQ